MDETKAPMAAATMLRGDHFYLRRWVNYYAKHIGREHLYILRHGQDEGIDEIAKGCNIIHLPFDPTLFCFNQRRWQMISFFVSGLTRYYNWVMFNDVDEIVGVDPDVSDNLVTYLSRFDPDARPRVITPFAIELMHNPTLEPQALEDDVNILDARRIFRLNANYAKPCITRNKITFSPGGHCCNEKQGYLDPDLYLFHMRFIDHDMTRDRLMARKKQRHKQSGSLEEVNRKVTGWDNAWDTYKQYATREPQAETVAFKDFRDEMVTGRHQKKGQPFWQVGGGRSKEVYKLPERFKTLF